MKARYALSEVSGSSSFGGKGGRREESSTTVEGSKSEVWRLMTMALVIDQSQKQRATAGK